MVRIAQILPGSIAEALSLDVGSRILRINGAPVRDVVDLRFLEADVALEVEIAPAAGGESVVYEIEKEPDEGLGIVPVADAVRQCANKCVFCFVDGNPQGARPTLHLKDDDFRLSFTVDLGDLARVRGLVPAFEYEGAMQTLAQHEDTTGQVAMACPSCGAPYAEGDATCGACGASLTEGYSA